jgi:hypothetical protein
MVKCGVFFAVRTEFLNITYVSWGFKLKLEVPATGHLDTGFLGFPQSLRKC